MVGNNKNGITYQKGKIQEEVYSNLHFGTSPLPNDSSRKQQNLSGHTEMDDGTQGGLQQIPTSHRTEETHGPRLRRKSQSHLQNTSRASGARRPFASTCKPNEKAQQFYRHVTRSTKEGRLVGTLPPGEGRRRNAVITSFSTKAVFHKLFTQRLSHRSPKSSSQIICTLSDTSK